MHPVPFLSGPDFFLVVRVSTDNLSKMDIIFYFF